MSTGCDKIITALYSVITLKVRVASVAYKRNTVQSSSNQSFAHERDLVPGVR